MIETFPRVALSVRQPWAWAIVYGGKDVENRTAAALRHMALGSRRRLAIHASKGMTREEYEEGAEFMASIGVFCPPAGELARGGIVGRVTACGIVRESRSPWFFGPRAIVLEEAAPGPFVAARGALGLFEWRPGDPADVPPAAKWMKATYPDSWPEPEPDLRLF